MEREAMAELTRVESVVEAWLSDFRNLVLDMLERSSVHRSASRRWPRPSWCDKCSVWIFCSIELRLCWVEGDCSFWKPFYITVSWSPGRD